MSENSPSNYCLYEKTLVTSHSKKPESFHCKESALASGLCKLHDENYLPEHESEIQEIMYQKLDESKESGLPLNCMGYHLPTLNFEDTTFSFPVYFTDVKFHGEVIFDYSKFDKYCDFSNVFFHNNASFMNVEFYDELNFSNIECIHKVEFQYGKFFKKSDFRYMTVKKGSFFSCEFNETDFSESDFNESISFASSIFKNEANFTRTKFHETVNFSGTKFFDEVKLLDTKFFKKCNFHHIKFSKPSLVLLDGNLSHVSFLNTDLTRVRFGNEIIWSKAYKKKFNKFSLINNLKYKIYDEWNLENSLEQKLELGAVMDVYRNLRENFDYFLRYDESGEFFVREMDLKRKFKQSSKSLGPKTIKRNPIYERNPILDIYNLISQYGQSFYRPIYSTSVIVALFVYIFLTKDLTDFSIFSQCSFTEIFSTFCNLADPIHAIIPRTLSGFFPFYSLYEKELTLFDFILKAILIPISGTFFIALKRKFERKFRH